MHATEVILVELINGGRATSRRLLLRADLLNLRSQLPHLAQVTPYLYACISTNLFLVLTGEIFLFTRFDDKLGARLSRLCTASHLGFLCFKQLQLCVQHFQLRASKAQNPYFLRIGVHDRRLEG